MSSPIDTEDLRRRLQALGRAQPPPPDGFAGVRARARRRHVVRLVASVGSTLLILAAAVTLAVTLPGSKDTVGPAASPSTRPSASTLPGLGADGYPVTVYPRPTASRNHNLLPACPSQQGVAKATRGNVNADAISFVQQYQAISWSNDLHGSDRALWPEIGRAWRSGDAHNATPRRLPILYSGALTDRWPSGLGAPNPHRWIQTACGSSLASASWVVVEGPRNGPALQGAFVFLSRNGHTLLYFTYP